MTEKTNRKPSPVLIHCSLPAPNPPRPAGSPEPSRLPCHQPRTALRRVLNGWIAIRDSTGLEKLDGGRRLAPPPPPPPATGAGASVRSRPPGGRSLGGAAEPVPGPAPGTRAAGALRAEVPGSGRRPEARSLRQRGLRAGRIPPESPRSVMTAGPRAAGSGGAPLPRLRSALRRNLLPFHTSVLSRGGRITQTPVVKSASRWEHLFGWQLGGEELGGDFLWET